MSKKGPAIWDLPVEILQHISSFLPSKANLQWMLASRWSASVIGGRIVHNAIAWEETSVFVWACRVGRVDIMRRCMDGGMSPKLRIRQRDGHAEYLPLIGVSMLSGHLDAIRLLISRGATVNHLPRQWCLAYSRKALYYARHQSTLQFLVRSGSHPYADPNDDRLFIEMIKAGFPDNTIIFAVENALGKIIPDVITVAAQQGRRNLVKKLFKAAPQLAICDDPGGPPSPSTHPQTASTMR